MRNQPGPLVDMAALGMLASAIAGQPLTVRSAPPGQRTHADGHEIVLAPTHDLAAARQAVVCQALLLAIDSLHERGLRALIGQRRRCRRYMQWELARALARHGQRLPADLEHWLGGHTASPAPKSSQQSLDWASDADLATRLPAWPRHLGTIRPARTTWQQLAGRQPAPLSATVSDRMASLDGDEDAEDDPLTSKLLQWFSSPLGGGSVGSLFLKLLGMGAPPAKGRGTASTAQGVAATLAGEHQVLGARPPDAQSCPPGSPTGQHRWQSEASAAQQRHRYPEWVEAQGRYRADWVSVQEMPPMPSTAVTDHSPPSSMRMASAAVRQQIARIGIEFERHRAQPDGQDLDLDALVSQAVDRRQGSGTDGRLYLAARRTRRDLSLLVLLDISHSTGDRDTQGMRVIDQQIAMAREIARASSLLGDQVGLYAFHSWGRHLVQCLRIKGLNERSHPGQIAQGLNSLTPSGMTRMGAAIRHATALMVKQARHSHRVILLLSDGFAYDDEYEGRHARQDTAKALSEAQASGLACVCLNIGSQQDDDVLKQLYGSAAYLRCADASRAVPALRQLMRHAMASAAVQKRPAKEFAKPS